MLIIQFVEYSIDSTNTVLLILTFLMLNVEKKN